MPCLWFWGADAINNENSKSMKGSIEANHKFSVGSNSRSPLLSSQSSSSIRSRFDIDSALYNGRQSLASILNHPHLGKSGVYSSDASWSTWWPFSWFNSLESTSIAVSKGFPKVNESDFQAYLDAISKRHGCFEDVRKHWSRE